MPGPRYSRRIRRCAAAALALSAEQVQDGVHRLLHDAPQLGWAYQVGTAPGVALECREARRLDASLGRGVLGAVRGYWSASAGTARVTVRGFRARAPTGAAAIELFRAVGRL